LIETTDSSVDSDENKYDTLKLMVNSNPLIRLVIYGKLKRMMLSYVGDKVRTVDKNLIRGIFLRKIYDFDEDYKE
jgi:hypothetical protein